MIEFEENIRLKVALVLPLKTQVGLTYIMKTRPNRSPRDYLIIFFNSD